MLDIIDKFINDMQKLSGFSKAVEEITISQLIFDRAIYELQVKNSFCNAIPLGNNWESFKYRGVLIKPTKESLNKDE